MMAPFPSSRLVQGACVAALLLFTACGRGTPTTPSTQTPPSAAVTLDISGPANILPGAIAQFTAKRTNADGSSADATRSVVWRSSDAGVLVISAEGVATTRGRGEATITASLGTLSKSSAVTVAEDGTFILTAMIRNSLSISIPGALVEVIEGTGTGLRATADQFATARLYGVAGPIRLRISAPGYDSTTLDLAVNSHSFRSLVLPGEGTGLKISGTLYVHSAGGVTVGSNRQISGWIESSTISNALSGPTTDGNGRFQFTVPTRTTRVWLIGELFGNVLQPCTASAAPPGDQTVDIHLNPDSRIGGWLPPGATTHVLSGIVYEQTAEGPRGIAGAHVGLDITGTGDGFYIASTTTGPDGRYALCTSVPMSPTLLLVNAAGFESASALRSINGPTSQDVLMRRK